MELMGQGLVLMVAGMGIVYVFLYVLIVVSNTASRFVSRFDHVISDDSPKKSVGARARRRHRPGQALRRRLVPAAPR